jgi:hypothetical protein
MNTPILMAYEMLSRRLWQHRLCLSISIAQYSSILQNAACTFAHLTVYSCDLCGIFMQGICIRREII